MLTCSYTRLAHTFDEDEGIKAGFMRFLYRRMYIPSGMVFTGYIYCRNLETFRTLMGVWNRVGGKIWKFWED